MYEHCADRYFRTTSFYLSAYLISKGLELVNLDRSETGSKATFVFLDTPEREHFVERYNYAQSDYPELLVDARKLIASIKTLKDKLHQPC